MRKIIILGTAAAAAIFAHYSQGAENFQDTFPASQESIQITDVVAGEGGLLE